jgi:hypothetical protein
MYLYIVGRGHSGSMILDILLGNSSQIESVGQLLSGMRGAGRECAVAVRRWRILPSGVTYGRRPRSRELPGMRFVSFV